MEHPIKEREAESTWYGTLAHAHLKCPPGGLYHNPLFVIVLHKEAREAKATKKLHTGVAWCGVGLLFIHTP